MLDATDYAPRLRTHYREVVKPKLKEEFGYKNDLMIPRIEKITLNMGVGEAVADSKKIKAAHDDLMKIAGQKPIVTKAKKSIAGFKVREGMPLGLKVTLRRDRMYEFMDRLITIALPRVRDFRGLKGKLDGRGNYSMGLREHIVFPEIEYDKIEKIMGLNVTIVTTARTDEEGRSLLRHLGMPFR